MVEFTGKLEQEFQCLYDNPDVQSSDLVRWADSKVTWPSMIHFTLHQQVWVRDRQRDRLLRGQNADEMSVLSEYEESLSQTNYLCYFLKYIQPVFCSPEKGKEFQRFSEQDKRWVDNVIDKVVGFARLNDCEKETLVDKIRERDPVLAERLVSEGFAPRYENAFS